MIVYFGIGSNLGDREANLRRAIELLHERVGECMACSSIYRSAPQGFVSDNQFANIVAICQTNHSPEEVLHITQQIEFEMGRLGFCRQEYGSGLSFPSPMDESEK